MSLATVPNSIPPGAWRPARKGVGASRRSRSPTGISRCYSCLFEDNRPQTGALSALSREGVADEGRAENGRSAWLQNGPNISLHPSEIRSSTGSADPIRTCSDSRGQLQAEERFQKDIP